MSFESTQLTLLQGHAIAWLPKTVCTGAFRHLYHHIACRSSCRIDSNNSLQLARSLANELAMAATNTLYDFHYVANVTSEAAIFRSLVGEGPLVVAADHLLAILLPDALEDAAAGGKEVTMRQLEFLTGDGLIYDRVVSSGGTHFTVGKDRWTALVRALDTGGLDKTPIPGSAIVALPKAAARILEVLQALPNGERAIVTGDVIYSGNSDDAGTGRWYDWLTPGMLTVGDSGQAVLKSFNLLTPGRFLNDTRDGGRRHADFHAVLDAMEGAVGRDISASSQQVQAAAVAEWLRRTNPTKGYARYIPTESIYAEIERRVGRTPAERFEPLFVEGWRTACAALHTLWPEPVENPTEVTLALAVSFEMHVTADGLTPQIAINVNTMVQGLLSFVTKATNEARTVEIARAHRDQAQVREARAEVELTSEARRQLQENTEFTELKDAISAGGHDYVAAAKAMLDAKHGAGMLFLNNRFAPDKFWKELNGARTESTLQSVFNEALSVSTAGKAQEWGVIIPPGFAKTMISGRFVCNWWDLFKLVVSKREGTHIVNEINKRVKGMAARSFWSDPERLRLAEVPVRTCMALLKLGANDAYSFPAWYRTIVRLATSIENMPSTYSGKSGMGNRLEEVAMQGLQCVSDRTEAMLATPASAITRLSGWVTAGQALNALNGLASSVERVQKEIDDGMHGMAINPAHNVRSDPPKRERDGDDWWRQSGKRQREDSEWWRPTEQWDSAERNEVQWGSAAKNLGVYSNDDGTKLAFGGDCVTFANAPDLKANCAACYAPSRVLTKRDKWCPHPMKCWKAKGAEAHERVDQFDDEACNKSGQMRQNDPDWADFTITIAKPTAPQATRGFGGRGGGGRGYNVSGGKGGRGGKGGKGGKGDGGKGGNDGKGGKGSKGKGGKGGGGKGGRGRGGAGFQRQW